MYLNSYRKAQLLKQSDVVISLKASKCTPKVSSFPGDNANHIGRYYPQVFQSEEMLII